MAEPNVTSFEDFSLKLKPGLDTFLRNPNKNNLRNFEKVLSQFTFSQLQIFHVQILLPLVLKLEKINGLDQEIQTGTMHCIRMVVSKLYMRELTGLKTMLAIVVNQIRDCDNARIKANLSEEIKLATVECITELLQRSTSDVLEQYYTEKSSLFLGQILLTLVEFIEQEKYKKLVIASLNCLMTIFYVHDLADEMDVVLRSLVADTLFIFLPKIVTVLFKTCLADEKLGETPIMAAVTALGRILTVIFEQTNDTTITNTINVASFKKLIDEMNINNSAETPNDADVLGTRKPKEHMEELFKKLRTAGRSKYWFAATSRKLKIIFQQLIALRSHNASRVRHEYAKMCCALAQKCATNLHENFFYVLENVIAMAEDEEQHIRMLCQQTLGALQTSDVDEQVNLFDESAELLFNDHLNRLPRIISRCDDAEQYAELLFLKGFLRNLSAIKLQALLALPRNLEMFSVCLLAAANLKITRELLVEDYALREVVGEQDFPECAKLHWRQFTHLHSVRCARTLQHICSILGQTEVLNRMLFDYFMDLFTEQSEVMKEAMLLMLWMATAQHSSASDDSQNQGSRRALVDLLLNEVLSEKHWHLALQPDQMRRLKVDKHTDWFVDRTPGLYESAIEIRMQDCDSDDDNEEYEKRKNMVTIADAQFNVLHTCVVQDVVGHCATALGEQIESYLFRCLHRVLLKVGNSNTIIYQSANFALISMQKALKFAKTTHFIESYTDYITYHMNRILKRNPESKSAVEILMVVLQFSSRNALPHLDSIFQTIREECGKSYQSQNVVCYLKVFLAFLTNVSKWHVNCEVEINNAGMQIDDDAVETNVLRNWLTILRRRPVELLTTEEQNTTNAAKPSKSNVEETNAQSSDDPNNNSDKVEQTTLPQHINAVKDILEQVSKFLSSSVQVQQILTLECLICGVPLLSDYEDELLPLVHRIWQPLVERFRQKDVIVLNRCFTLIDILGQHARDFITKRSLNDIIPYLVQFLKDAAVHSEIEKSLTHTQEYKLQFKLLDKFSHIAQNLQIEGKHLHEISDVLAMYLSSNQPKELQVLAENYFKCLRLYDGPLVYLIVLKKSHLKDYKENVDKVLKEFEINE